jgi:hypothetical protein
VVVVLFLFLPETGRGIVNHGSLPAQGVNRPLFFVHGSSKAEEGKRSRLNGPTFRLHSPFKPLKIAFCKAAALELG